jgi:hypothetical protein
MRMVRVLPFVIAASASVLLLVAGGCAAVPDIQFVPDDARADGPPGDGGRDAPVDTGPVTCTAPSPGVDAVCCGASWCVGDCGGSNCGVCAAKCSPSEVCCGKPGNVLCKDKCN